MTGQFYIYIEHANLELDIAFIRFKAKKLELNVNKKKLFIICDKQGLIATTLSVLEALFFKVDENFIPGLVCS